LLLGYFSIIYAHEKITATGIDWIYQPLWASAHE
jgi:hypothetical protein